MGGYGTAALTRTNFISNTTYTVTVSAGEDVAGNDLDNVPYTWSFAAGGTVSEGHDVHLRQVPKNHWQAKRRV